MALVRDAAQYASLDALDDPGARIGVNEGGHLERAASLVVDDPKLTEPVLAAYSRLVLVGADGQRLHEELFAAGRPQRKPWA